MNYKSSVIDVDYYKTTQPRMYAPWVKGLFSYAEARGGAYSFCVPFGLQAYIKEKLLVPVTKEDVDFADLIISSMGIPFDRTAWDIVVTEFNGYVPFVVKALPEGFVVPTGTAVVTLECTDERLFSLVNYYETALLRAVWFPSTIATRSLNIRDKIENLYSLFADTDASSDFAFIDFSARGVSGQDSSILGSAAYLTSWKGTDTCAAVGMLYSLYGGTVAGFSVAASEHSVMCSWGEENEKASFEALLEGTPDGEVLSVVSDTWNIYRACEYWVELADRIKEKGVRLVIRPDSGDPLVVLPKMLSILEKGFETEYNDKGLKVFPNLGILWADGISEGNVKDVLYSVILCGFGPENITLGSGGGLMQKVNRDTMKWAFKASAILDERTNDWVGIAKDPITDQGKRSKKGRLDVIQKEGIETVPYSPANVSLLEPVYSYNPETGKGELLREQTIEEIRALIKEG